MLHLLTWLSHQLAARHNHSSEAVFPPLTWFLWFLCTYQSAHITMSKCPSSWETSVSLSHRKMLERKRKKIFKIRLTCFQLLHFFLSFKEKHLYFLGIGCEDFPLHKKVQRGNYEKRTNKEIFQSDICNIYFTVQS